MNVRVIDYRPPKIAQLFLLVAMILNWLTPMSELIIYSNQLLGLIMGISGFGVMMSGWWLFRKFDTAVCPTARTDHLVTSGVYRYTRNPMYLGVITMLLAVAIYVGTLPFYLATIAYFVVINNNFCPYEEDKLTRAFGDTYISYKKRVRCWI